MSQGNADDTRAVDPVRGVDAAREAVREAARREVAAAMRRVALDSDGTGVPPAEPAAPPSPSAGAKRTAAALPGAPGPSVARPSRSAGDVAAGRGGAPGGATAREGEEWNLASSREAFDRWFDRQYPALARRPASTPTPASQPAPQPADPTRDSHADIACGAASCDFPPRQLTAARLLLAGMRVGEVAARLGVDRHTVSGWLRSSKFQREVRRMAAQLPVEALLAPRGDCHAP